jgi:hypothetical protein
MFNLIVLLLILAAIAVAYALYRQVSRRSDKQFQRPEPAAAAPVVPTASPSPAPTVEDIFAPVAAAPTPEPAVTPAADAEAVEAVARFEAETLRGLATLAQLEYQGLKNTAARAGLDFTLFFHEQLQQRNSKPYYDWILELHQTLRQRIAG